MRWRLAVPSGAVIGASMVYIVALALAIQMPWWYQMLWPGFTIALALDVIRMFWAREIDQRTVALQASVIRSQLEHIHKIHQLLARIGLGSS